jgi:ABC-type lipoprotein release transport system permease subunit
MKIIDLVLLAFRNLLRRKLRTILTIVSVMVGAFLISIMMSISNGMQEFLISQVTLFTNQKTINVRPDTGGGDSFSLGGDVTTFEEESETKDRPEKQEDVALDKEDLDKVRNIEGVKVAHFQHLLSPQYIHLSSGDFEDSNDKLQLAMFGLPLERREKVRFAAVERSLLKKEDSIVLSDSYIEKWGLDRNDVIGKRVLVNIKQMVPDAVLENNVQREGVLLSDDDNTQTSLQDKNDYNSLQNNVNPKNGDASNSDELGVESSPDQVSNTNNPSNATNNSDNINKNDKVPNTDSMDDFTYDSMQPELLDSLEDKDFEFVIAGVTEKSLLSQWALISNKKVSEIKAYQMNTSVESIKENEDSFGIVLVTETEEDVDEVDRVLEEMGYLSDTYEDAIGHIGSVFDIVNYLLSSFGIIALVVASIGIVNTLLMTVYERTREIGVMKAVGATRRNIASMITVEAVLLGVFGGAVGLGISWGIGRLADHILHKGLQLGETVLIEAFLYDYPQYNVSLFSWDIVFLVMIVTTSVTFIAGLYPAWKASNLDPIEALRAE